ncbi:hypothetical protein [Paenibacillus sp. FSL R7-0273]|uniref:hypothetical protein n=1 Tax=Paenibacillus sp. FSL R7-0273 TaxID=1536772 RepID=UPI000694D7B1|nr:hypothetical protein [Paenibacillus sp. FSL R7-0273]OMF95301.1 hypothetical protein BK144_07190 [Paenibacillus sp. FSL R7-0273]
MEQKYVLPYINSSLLSIEIKGEADWQRKVLQMLWEMKQSYDDRSWGWEYELSIKTVQVWFSIISNITLSAEETSKANKLQQERLQLILSYIHQDYPKCWFP